jgi:hypothetical protein
MTRWPIARKWTVTTDGAIDAETAELAKYSACVLLGAGGLGKTFEIEHLAGLELSAGRDVRKARLVDLAVSADLLASRLDALASGATAATTIFLDALDEVMVPVKQAGKLVAAWLRTVVRESGASVRISCRSAIFPESVRAALEDVYQKKDIAFASLQSLANEDIDRVVTSVGFEAAAFRHSLDRAGVQSLAEQPLTLEMLLDVYRDGGDLPASRLDLLDRGLRRLATERVERRDEGLTIAVSPADLVEAAERLACFSLLSGRETVDYSDAPTNTSLSATDLADLPGGNHRLDDEMLRALRNSGLFERDGVYRFRFAHRQFAEYLAGRRLSKLLPHQARAVLASPLGWQYGVAGPLRETASFAAMANSQIAAWVAETDPEIIGISDVADASLRRLATRNLLDKLRHHELTDAQLSRGQLDLRGFQYPDAEHDLRAILRDHSTDQDVLDGAIRMVDAWRLDALSEPLADLVLDSAAPIRARELAGYALMKFGHSEARARLKSLTLGSPDDPDENLKGIALHCNYPEHLSVTELLAALTPPKRRLFGGAYSGFLHRLDTEQFDASGFRADGLTWARTIIRADPTSDSDPLTRIARRIARAAITELEDPTVTSRLLTLLHEAAQMYAPSPVTPARSVSILEASTKDQEHVSNKPENVRRRLLTAIAQSVTKHSEIRWVAESAAMLSPSDLEWLLSEAVNEKLGIEERTAYVQLARMVPWDDEERCVNLWLAVRELEPVKSRFPFPLVIDLQSEEAKRLRKQHQRSIKKNTVQADAEDQIARQLEETLQLAESKDPRYFVAVANLLTVTKADPHRYGFERFLTKTERWADLPQDTRLRVVAIAKQMLANETEEPEKAKSDSLTSIRGGYMPAVWLLNELDPSWLDGQSEEWWHRWGWYFVRELHPRLSGEDDAPKRLLLNRLFARVGDELNTIVCDLATRTDAHAGNLVDGLLDLSADIAPPSLDRALSELMADGSITSHNVGHIANFLLNRDADRGLQACFAQLEGSSFRDPDAVSIVAAIALLSERPGQSWTRVSTFLQRRPDLARQILGGYAQTERLRLHSDDRPEVEGGSFSIKQAGGLASDLIDSYPYDSDPVYDGAHWVSPDDSARHLRDQLIGWLSEQRDVDAVEALKTIEHRYGTRFPGLRRPRATAERGYRLARWAPIAPASVAALLAADEKRLIRSAEDALDGVSAAVEAYNHALRHSSPSDLEDFWNRPKGAKHTPKEEEHASEKICKAIREYFQAYAVTADREVQIFRRLVSRLGRGAPGSEVDVLCRIPASATTERDAIAIPVEVKLAHNPDARESMRTQLAKRYMNELGTDSGAYVVVWMDAPKLAARYKPLWRTTAEVRDELRKQAEDLEPDGLDIRVIVIDTSLPMAASSAHGVIRRSSIVRASPPTKRTKPSKEIKSQRAVRGRGPKKVSKKRSTKRR